jgi:hypothetical protein
MTMATNNELVLKQVLDKNLVIQLWVKITSFPILKIKLSKFIKLAEITRVNVLGFVKDERCFSTMLFIKKQAKELLVVPFASLHLILYTMVLQT